jgi:C-terminal processing protease CtpA/Prc
LKIHLFGTSAADGGILLSPASAAGVRPGWEVLRIDGVPVRGTTDEIAALEWIGNR